MLHSSISGVWFPAQVVGIFSINCKLVNATIDRWWYSGNACFSQVLRKLTYLLEERIHQRLLCRDASSRVNGQQIKEELQQVLIPFIRKHALERVRKAGKVEVSRSPEMHTSVPKPFRLLGRDRVLSIQGRLLTGRSINRATRDWRSGATKSALTRPRSSNISFFTSGGA